MPVSAQAGAAAAVNAKFGEFAERHGLAVDVRRGMFVVIDELVANVVSHGGGAVTDAAAMFEVELQPDRLTATITDNGAAFNPLDRPAPDTTLSIEERPIGGLGIHLVRQMVDDIHYQRRDGQNVVVIVKYLVGRSH